jgi:tRNA-2-methylthio-N6-dimethylallyladenosine synthase
MNQKTYYIETYGCQMNVYDSELVSTMMHESGYKKTDDLNTADAIFLNTCSIREKAEETVYNRLDNFQHLKRKNPSLLIGVLGCMAQNLKDELLEHKPYVDIILGPDSYRNIPKIINDRSDKIDHFVDTKLSKFEIYDDLVPSRNKSVNSWVSIMRGCDKFCTFCIVPFTRGRERSRPIKSIINEVKDGVNNGFVEFTLLGQNVNSYNTPDGKFPVLLDKVAQIDGLKRLRFMSPHPQDVDDHMLEVMAKHHNICNQVHLPIQAGSDRILKRMNRSYTSSEFLALVVKIKNYMPDCSITTDIIVGFPGETEEEFCETLSIAKKVRFNFAYMFKYSSRPGTKASQYDDQISEDVKQKRLERLIVLQLKNTLLQNRSYIYKTIRVLVEKESKKSNSQWSGRTEGGIWVVFDKNNEKIGDLVDIKIEDARGVTLFGSRVQGEYKYEVA